MRIIERDIVDHVDPNAHMVPTCCGGVPMEVAKIISSAGEGQVLICQHCKKTYLPGEKVPEIVGSVQLQLIHAETGQIEWEHGKNNIFTDVGRNYLASVISYKLLTEAAGVDEPAANKRRYDGVRYIGAGKDSFLETNSVTKLKDPVVYNSAGHYLAPVVAPNVLPGSGISAIFHRTFGVNEISMPTAVILKEVGLFVSGPASGPTNPSLGTNAPIAYYTFEGVSKTTAFLFAVQWEIKF